jgi:SAM-dependent methyltransferase
MGDREVMLKRLKQVMLRWGRRQAPLRDGDSAPPEEAPASWYDAWFESSGTYQRPYYEAIYYFLWTVIVDRARRAGARRVLEIGCGSGQLAAFLLDQGVEEYLGLDFSPAAIGIAKKMAPRGRFLVADARSPIGGILENVPDLIVCTEVLEHVPEDLLIVSQFPEGVRCILTVPSFAYPSHVRHFADAHEARNRYAEFFVDLDVLTLPSPRSPLDRFYVLDGVRNGKRHEPG